MRRWYSAAVQPLIRTSMDDTATDSQVSFSRPTTSGFGKCTETLKCLVPDETKTDFARVARERGYPSDSDCLRELVMAFTYGPEHLRRLHANRIDALAKSMAGIGTSEGS